MTQTIDTTPTQTAPTPAEAPKPAANATNYAKPATITRVMGNASDNMTAVAEALTKSHPQSCLAALDVAKAIERFHRIHKAEIDVIALRDAEAVLQRELGGAVESTKSE